MPSKPTASDWILLLALVLVWGTTFLVIKVAVSAIPPATLVAGRLTIAALLLLVLGRAAGLRLPRGWSIWAHFLVLALVGNAIPFYLISWGQERIDSGLAGILMAVMPLATLMLAHFFVEGELLTWRRIVGFLLGFLGIVVLTGPQALLAIGGESSDLIRQLAVLGGALCYAINAILARRLPPLPALVVSACVMSMASLCMIPVATIFDAPWTVLADAPYASQIALVWLGFVSTAVATVIFFRIIASAGPTFLSLINFQIPIVAVVAGALVLGERLQWNALAALVLVLSGLALSQSSAPAPRPGIGRPHGRFPLRSRGS